jgi:hypothetical protein
MSAVPRRAGPNPRVSSWSVSRHFSRRSATVLGGVGVLLEYCVQTHPGAFGGVRACYYRTAQLLSINIKLRALAHACQDWS